MLHINNGLTINLDLIKLKWSDKTITLSGISLNPGQFKITYDTLNKIITLKNGMNAFGPLCTYEDANRKLSVDLLNLVNDYSKTMTLKWYQDNSNNITGVYLDTDNANLVDWIVFESIKYDPNGATGRRIALGGFQADDFKIMKNDNDQLEISGQLYIANHLTYSRLVNLATDEWEDLNLQWDLNADGIGYIEMNSEFSPELKLSTKLAGVDFTATLDLTQYLKISWDVDFDGQGYIFLDTNGTSISQISFQMEKNTTQYQPKWGLNIVASSLSTEDYMISWDFTSPYPSEWYIIQSGYLEPGSLIEDIWLAWNGNWYHFWHMNNPMP
jgi:hypothetical protein